ncbi:MAG: gliding motility-associated C-terminal domain-containing protein, partial [Bacteroidales bacterium]
TLDGGTPQASGLFTGLSAGTYTLEVTDDNGCTDDMTITITEPDALVISEVTASHIDVDCFGNTTGELEVTATDGTSPYEYTLDGGTPQSDGLFTGLAAGTYTLEVTDDNGCTDDMTITITEPDALVISEVAASHMDVDCFGNATGELEVTATDGTSPYEYTLDGGTPQSDGQFTGLTAGTYNLEVTDDNGCTDDMTITITEPDALVISEVAASHVDVDCFGNATGELEVTATDGTSPYSYTLDGGAAQSTGLFTGLTAGTYTLEVSDDNGCTDNMDITITEPIELTASLIDVVNQVCTTPGSAEVEATGGTSPYTYNWPATAGGVSEGVASSLTADTYTVTVVDDNLCEFEIDVVIVDDGAITTSSSVNAHPLCFGDNNGSVDITISDGNPDYTIDWGSGSDVTSSSSYTITGLGDGAYDITITDADGCEDITTTTLIEPNELLISEVSGSHIDVDCFGNATGELEVTATDGTSPYEYTLDGGTPQASGLFTGLSAGTYTLEVTDDNGCTQNMDITITQPDELLISEVAASHVDVDCFGNATGELEVTATDGTSPYSYTLDGGAAQGTGLFTGLTAGTYTLEVTDDNGCSDNIDITITQPDELLISEVAASHVDVDCFGNATGELEVTATDGTSPYSYSLDGGAAQGTGLFTGLTAGTYTLEVTDDNGCTDNMDITITQPDELLISEVAASHVDVDCFGNATGELEVTATDGTSPYSYTLDGGAAQGTGLFTGLTAGTYTLEVTDDNGCTDNIDITITQPDELLISEVAASHIDVDCFGNATGELEVTATDGTSPYSYTLDGGAAQGTGLFTGLTAGTYTLEVTDDNGCTDDMTITITEPDELLISEVTASHVNVDCFGNATGELEVTATDGTSPYEYILDGGTPQSDGLFTGLTAGTYTLEVTDNNGCTDDMTVTITEPDALVISEVTASHIDVDCNGNATGELEVTATEGTSPYEYTLDGGTPQSDGLFTGLTAGTYTLEVIDDNGCVNNIQIEITQPDPIALDESVSPVICGDSPGECGVVATGGNGGYSFSWSHDASVSGNQAFDLTAGVYTITVEDAEGCSVQTSMTVGIENDLSVNITEDEPLTCHGEENASLIAECNDGLGDVEYFWPTVSEYGQELNNLGAGEYTVEVNDEYGCSGINSHIIVEPDAIQASFSVDHVSCHNGSDASVSVFAQGGISPYLFEWDELGNGAAQDSLSAGWYIVNITDDHGCETTDSILINQPDTPLMVDVIKQDITCYGYQDGRLSAEASGGTQPYHYEWNYNGNSTESESIFNLSDGSYQLNVTDNNGCTVDTSAVIFEPSPLIVDYYSQDPSCIGNNDGYIELEVSGGTEPYSYFLNDYSQNLPYFDDLYEGNYNIIVEDVNGCDYEFESINLVDVPEECIRIPDAFTPNGDDVNDTWIIENLEIFSDYQVQVFNRWGQIIYVGQPGDEPWDGTTKKGKLVPTGSYIYVIKLNNGTKPKSGVVSVVY